MAVKKHGRFEESAINLIPAWQITRSKSGCFIQVKPGGVRYINGFPSEVIPSENLQFRYDETRFSSNAVYFAQLCHSIGISFVVRAASAGSVMMQDRYKLHNPGAV